MWTSARWMVIGSPLLMAIPACNILVGIDKSYYLVGEGGTGGGGSGGGGSGGASVEPSAVGRAGEPCTPAGAFGCDETNDSSRLVCGMDNRWQANGSCDVAGTNCDSTAGSTQGTCKMVLPGCEGKTPETVVCFDKVTRGTCGPDSVGGSVIETCSFVCIDGACDGVCVPGSKECLNGMPRTCGDDGQWQSDAPCMNATQICVRGACEVTPTSCWLLPTTCGPEGDENCCQTEVVPGGTYNRSNDAAYPATVSDFYLDRFEITVGRFRAFVEAYPISKPSAGDGAHPKIPGSGWNSGWPFHADANALKAAVKCDNYTWTDMPAGNEHLPMNCLGWYEAFAFCAWDGGRLPTEAEWNYAAAGGNEQRVHPWGPAPLDLAHAVYSCLGNSNPDCVFGDILRVGSKSPLGDAKWGQTDMAGNMYEHVFDSFPDPYPTPCVDCGILADLTNGVIRGGGWYGGPADTMYLETSNRVAYNKTVRFDFVGARCARDKL